MNIQVLSQPPIGSAPLLGVFALNRNLKAD